MHLPLYIAKRYLFARKSHQVIHVISAISAIGMAIGTAALILILSVYNGFDGMVRSLRSSLEPDLLVSPAQGKVFTADSSLLAWLSARPEVRSVSGVLEDQVYIHYDETSGAARAKGVDAVYEAESPLGKHLTEGSFTLRRGDVPQAVVGAGLAASLQLSPRFLTPMELYYPSRTRPLSMMNPAASLDMVKVWPSGIFAVNEDLNKDLFILPVETMRSLLGYTGEEISALEIRLSGSPKVQKAFARTLSQRLGEDFLVKDREHQNVTLYRMMQYEKASIWLILLFVIVIIAFNIFGSLSMLIIEKEEDIETLRSLGMPERSIRRIFLLEGWMISLLGMVCGLAVGIILALLQQHFGFVTMPASWTHDPYPVRLLASDILLTAAGVAAIGYLIALLPVWREFRRQRFS